MRVCACVRACVGVRACVRACGDCVTFFSNLELTLLFNLATHLRWWISRIINIEPHIAYVHYNQASVSMTKRYSWQALTSVDWTKWDWSWHVDVILWRQTVVFNKCWCLHFVYDRFVKRAHLFCIVELMKKISLWIFFLIFLRTKNSTLFWTSSYMKV